MKQDEKNINLTMIPIGSTKSQTGFTQSVLLQQYWLKFSQKNKGGLFFSALSQFNQISHAEIQDKNIIIYFQHVLSKNQNALEQYIQNPQNPLGGLVKQMVSSRNRFLEIVESCKQSMLQSLKRGPQKRKQLITNLKSYLKGKICLCLVSTYQVKQKCFEAQRLIMSEKLIQILKRDPRKQIIKILNNKKVEEFFNQEQYIESNIHFLKFYKYLYDLFIQKQQFVDVPDTIFYEGTRFLIASDHLLIKSAVKYIYKHPGVMIINIQPLEEIKKILVRKQSVMQQLKDQKIKNKILKYEKFNGKAIVASYKEFDSRRDKNIEIITNKKK